MLPNIIFTIRKTEVYGMWLPFTIKKTFPLRLRERTWKDPDFRTTYMGRFGSYGKVGAIGQGKAGTTTVAPGQLTFKFLSKRFDYVKVVHITGSHEDTGTDLHVYILDEQAQ